ncbi:CaiB/BaiF CoA transferase family protein [Embleya sp. NBC_00896]|uniref:CaiB/BaiF CoA transferase family protein n=1 Tax=Embleya sp. NBC_00896 TaxID=2975961 RepID=UPI00386B7B05|nr:CoA transferase [Embleya sp. NBC_00896]
MERVPIDGPLAGVRVVDLSAAATGPYAVALLADQGADVIKVERPGIGDISRWIGTATGGISALYQMCNRGKRCVAVDLRTDEGREIVRALIAEADIVVQNWRPGVAERLGLGYADVRRDDLVYCSISGFGAEGPYAGKGAYDTVIQAYSGIAENQKDPETGRPRFSNQALADKVTALTAAQAITAALFARERGRGGQHLELSMLDAVISFLWVDSAGNDVLRDGDGSQPGSFVADVRPYAFLDGWGIATPTGDADFAGMCRAFGVEGYDDPRVATIAERRRHRELGHALVTRCHEAATKLTVAEGIARLEAENVPCGVVLGPGELATDPHVAAVGLLEDDVHPTAGRLRQPRHPARFGGTPARLGRPAPTLGADTDEILAELGFADRIGALRAAKVVC